MAQADGTIIIDTEIDADGMKAGSKEVEAAVRKMADSVNDMGTKAKAALNKQVDSFVKLNKEFAAQSKKVDELKKKVAEYGGQKIPTEEYQEIQMQIEKARKKLDGLIALQERFLSMGGNQKSNTYKRYQYDIDELSNTIRYAEGELRDLEQTGKAFTFGSQTKQAASDMEKLAAAERKLSNMNNRLHTSYSSIKGTVNDYNNNLLKTDKYQKRASASSNKLGKSLKNTGKAAKSANFGIGKMLGTSILFSFVFQAIGAATNAIKDGFTNLAQYSGTTNNSISMLWSSLERLKNSLATAFAPILDVVAPILSRFIDMLSTAASYVGMFFAALTGKSTYTRAVAVQKDYAASLEDSTDAMKDQAEATEEAEDAANGYLGPLDEIERYSDGRNKSSSNPNKNKDNDDLEKNEGPLFEEVPIDNKFLSLLDSVADKLKEIRDIFMSGFWDGLGDYKPIIDEMKKDLSSIGQSLKDIFTDENVRAAAKRFMESFIYNVGRIVGSLALVGLTITENIIGGIESYLSENKDRVKEHLISLFDIGTEISFLLGNFSVAFADVFSDVFGSQTAQNITGNIIGIFSESFMLAAELVSRIMRDIISRITEPFVENKEKIKTALLETLEPLEVVTQSIEDFVKNVSDTVLGVYDEHVKPYLDSVTDGLSSIFEKLLDGYNQYMVPVLDGLAERFSEVMEGPVGDALHSLGNLFGQLFDTLKALWEEILQPLFEWIAENIMPILAPIVEWIGNHLLNRISDIAFWIGSLADVLSALLEFIENVFKGNFSKAFEGIRDDFAEIWNNIKKHFSDTWGDMFDSAVESALDIKNKVFEKFNELKSKIFDVLSKIKDKFSSIFSSLVNLAKSPINSIISFLNGLLSAAETAQNWIADALSFDVDIPWPVSDMVGFDNFSIGIGKWDLPRIPYLASGAVIPPNKEFLAVLGDQKNGTNLEAPEDLLRKIVREETGKQQAAGGTYNFTAQINRRVLFQEMIEEARISRIRTGKNPFELA